MSHPTQRADSDLSLDAERNDVYSSGDRNNRSDYQHFPNIERLEQDLSVPSGTSVKFFAHPTCFERDSISISVIRRIPGREILLRGVSA